MPTYDYVCDSCEHTLEFFQSFKEVPKKKCPECGKLSLRRVISGGVGLVFKGSGFYVTDSRGGSKSSSNASATTNNANNGATKTADKTNSTTSEKKTPSSGGTTAAATKPAKAA